MGRLPVMCASGCVGTVVETCGHGKRLSKASEAVAPRQLCGRAMCDPRHVEWKSQAAVTGRDSKPHHGAMTCGRRRVALSWETRGNECVSFIPKERKGGGVCRAYPRRGPLPPPISGLVKVCIS